MPDDNILPNSCHEVKKTISSLGLTYEKIHACPNDCMLYRKHRAKDEAYYVCSTSRWKSNTDKGDEGCQEIEKKKLLKY